MGYSMCYGASWWGALLGGLVFILGTFVFSLVFWITARHVWNAKWAECCKKDAKKKKK